MYSLGPHFKDFSSVIWTSVQGTFVKSTVVSTTELCALAALQQHPGVLILDDGSWIRGDPPGQVEFAPLRARGADGRWEVPERYRGYSFTTLTSLISDNLGAGRFAASGPLFWPLLRLPRRRNVEQQLTDTSAQRPPKNVARLPQRRCRISLRSEKPKIARHRIPAII